MFSTVRIGSVFGIPVTLHWSLLLLAGWYVSSAYGEGGFQAAFASLGIPVGVFASILLHELGHVLVARRYGIDTRSINLSPIGGIAFLERYPETPGGRAAVAVGGPAVTLAIAVALGYWTMSVYGVDGLATPVGTLFAINTLLFVFNLLPIHPMDGGQVVVAAIMKVAGKEWADRYGKYSGQFGGAAMLAVGLWSGTLSLVVIGAFLFLSSALEFGNPFLEKAISAARRRHDAVESEGAAARSLDGEAIGPAEGVFVAFDGDGRHFAYATHWIGSGDEADQKATILAYAREARERGGEMRFLPLDEFRRIVLAPEPA